MLTTAGNFDLHTSLCAEAQQIADNVEASTDERIVLLMCHLRHHMPRSRSRERALPILDHLQVSFVQMMILPVFIGCVVVGCCRLLSIWR
jgi:hypothetical protein